MSYKYGVYGKSIGNTPERPGYNAVAFATHDEADRAGRENLSRWCMPDGYVVVESDEPVNYTFPAGTSRPVPLAVALPASMPIEPVRPMSGDPALAVDLSDPEVGRLP